MSRTGKLSRRQQLAAEKEEFEKLRKIVKSDRIGQQIYDLWIECDKENRELKYKLGRKEEKIKKAIGKFHIILAEARGSVFDKTYSQEAKDSIKACGLIREIAEVIIEELEKE
jgi:hypothetical protein